jgi:hypothetical protein
MLLLLSKIPNVKNLNLRVKLEPPCSIDVCPFAVYHGNGESGIIKTFLAFDSAGMKIPSKNPAFCSFENGL